VAIENEMKKARLARVRPLSCRNFNRCCSHLGLAILRRCNGRELGRSTRLDEATGRFRKASGTCPADCARRPLDRPGESAADGTGFSDAAANRGATRR
jgi:hypothetical protein